LGNGGGLVGRTREEACIFRIRRVHGGECPHLCAASRVGEDIKLENPLLDAPIEKAAKFPFNEPGGQTIAPRLPGQKCFDVSGHNAIEYALFRTTRAAFAGTLAYSRFPAA
jgi:hypothetical protein